MTTARTCSSCVHYSKAAAQCTHWWTEVAADYGCQQWVGEYGSRLTPEDGEVWLRVSIEDGKVEQPRQDAEERRRRHLPKDVDRMAIFKAIIDDGLTWTETQKRLGVTRKTIAYHLRGGATDGLIRRVGYGKYEWAKGGGDMAEQAIGRDEVQRMIDAAVEAAVEAAGEGEAQIWKRISRIEEQIESLQVQLTAVVDRLNQHRESAEQQDRQLDVLAAEITRLQQQGGGTAERALRLVEQVLGLAERRWSA